MATTYFANTANASGSGTGRQFLSNISVWFKHLFCLMATYRLRRELAALDDRLLRDIGLDRDAISNVSVRNNWDY